MQDILDHLTKLQASSRKLKAAVERLQDGFYPDLINSVQANLVLMLESFNKTDLSISSRLRKREGRYQDRVEISLEIAYNTILSLQRRRETPFDGYEIIKHLQKDADKIIQCWKFRKDIVTKFDNSDEAIKRIWVYSALRLHQLARRFGTDLSTRVLKQFEKGALDFEDVYVLVGKKLSTRASSIDEYYFIKPRDVEAVQKNIEYAHTIFITFCDVWQTYKSAIKYADSAYKPGDAEVLLQITFKTADDAISLAFDKFFHRMNTLPSGLLDTLSQLEKR